MEQRAIQNPTSILVDASGRIFAAGVNFDSDAHADATVIKFDDTGQEVASYSRTTSDDSACLSANGKLLIDTRGDLLAACLYGDIVSITKKNLRRRTLRYCA